jgi:transcriptional regulator with XRE-family HTH domain
MRTERGYSQEGFADKCGVHRTFMGTIERGESNLSFLNIAKVATTVGVPLSALFLGLEERAQVLSPQQVSATPTQPKKRAAAKRRST